MRNESIKMKVDKIGRVSIPVDFRRELGIEYKDQLEILIDGDELVLRKHKNTDICVFCGCEEPLIYKCELICLSCLEELRSFRNIAQL
jgi:AbrB family transcriptional regulator, transcriptional pleiotropic regulator of transition state genes